MRLLAVDTAEKSCSLALVEDGALVCEEFYSSPASHSATVMDMVNHLLCHRAKLIVDDLDGLVVAKGPGSFTGLRIGISVVKGLAFAASKPCAGVSSLDGIAWQFSAASRPVCAMMDARRGEVYCAVYRFEGGRLVHKSRERALSPEKAADRTAGDAIFAGSGAIAHREVIVHCLGSSGDPVFVPGFQNHVRASALAEVPGRHPSLLSRNPGDVVPVYLRKSDAQINHEKNARPTDTMTPQ